MSAALFVILEREVEGIDASSVGGKFLSRHLEWLDEHGARRLQLSQRPGGPHLQHHQQPADRLIQGAAVTSPRRSAVAFGHLAPATLYRVYYPAREAPGRPDLRFHDLRHTGAVLAAATGATLAELMARLDHSTAGAAPRYQHAAEDRDKAIASALSELAAGTVTPISTAKRKGTRVS